jgi:protein-S-isoprenylcysteine O-methyltransferase Ste14
MSHGGILRLSALSITAAWVIWFVVWAITSLRAKPVVYRESVGSRLSYTLPIIASVLLLLLAKASRLGSVLIAAGPAFTWLYVRFIRLYPGAVWIGSPLVIVGVLITFWARFYLAGNWSGSVTLKQDHELIRTGPYRFVRHPIYTGALIAVLGTAFAIGQFRGLLAFALTFFALWYKSRIEEKLMIENFGDAYRSYRACVKGLIPFVF